MKKDNLLKLLDNSSYVALIIASVLILVFEMTGTKGIMTLALLIYAAAFLMGFVLSIMKIIEIKKLKNKTAETNKTESNELESVETENSEVLIDEKTEKLGVNITKLVISCICFAFLIVFLAMF